MVPTEVTQSSNLSTGALEANMSLLENTSSTFIDDLNCPDYDWRGELLLKDLGFWLEGVVQTTVAICGILCNLASALILSSKEMRNSFNLLLIALSFFDACYLFGSILESFRKSFKLVTDVHTLLFPYFLYPGQMIVMTASIFMTVAIAMERYAAVHYPLDYNQAMNDERASFRRLLKYVIPVFSFAFVFNIPKFFEAEVIYKTATNSSPLERPILSVTQLRTDPDYATYYNSWTRLAVIGIIPFAMLVFFNTKIYKDIQFRRSRRCPRPRTSGTSPSGEEGRSLNGSNNGGTPHQQNTHLVLNNGTSNHAINTLARGSSHNVNRRHAEDNLAVIFMGIVLVFLVCHFPRVVLSLHESWVIKDALLCGEAGKKVFPLWALVVSYFSHLLLVINSSVNSLIYCMLSSRFRIAALKWAQWLGCVRRRRVPFGINSKTSRNNVNNNGNNVVEEEGSRLRGVEPDDNEDDVERGCSSGDNDTVSAKAVLANSCCALQSSLCPSKDMTTYEPSTNTLKLDANSATTLSFQLTSPRSALTLTTKV